MDKQHFEEIIVIGVGKVAVTCALKAKEVFNSVSFIESGSNGITPPHTLQAKGIGYLSMGKQELTAYLNALTKQTLIVSASNRYLFPKEIIEKDNLTIINYHGALLPHYPGRNAECWTIYEGNTQGGLTWHLVTPEVDAGDILIQKTTEITDKTTSFSLLRTYSNLAIEGFCEILPAVFSGVIKQQVQVGEREQVRYSWMKPNDGVLNTDWDYRQISCFLRAMDYGPIDVMGKPKIVIDGNERIITKYVLQADSENAGYYYIRKPEGIIGLQLE